MFPILVLLAVGPRNGSWLGSGGWVKKSEVETHAPVGPVARGVCIIFSADLNANRLFSDFEDLAYLENDWDRPLGVARRVVPVGRRFRVERESRMRAGRVGDKGLEKHLADALAILLGSYGPELVHQRACG